ncbi:MAG: hypothetical protein IPP49_07255 [Saprospiraceae bacterium]|nr:hypothetical protein [Saprospiraceae bacterium]
MSTSEKKIIWLAGGDGLVGKHLIGMLDPTSYHIAVLSRRKRVSVSSRIEYILWDTEKQYIDSNQNLILSLIWRVQGLLTSDGQTGAKRNLSVVA